MRQPLLFVSDNPNGSSGLGTITAEIASRAYEHLSDVCEVAVAGYGNFGENRMPFSVYPFAELKNGVISQLPWIWREFAGDRKGILFSIWNIAWLSWLTHPEVLEFGEVRAFLKSKPFKLWSYVPVDSVCLNDRLSSHEENILKRIDRVLAYTKFGADAIDRTMGIADEDKPQTQHLAHGTDGTMFYPRSRRVARTTLLRRIGKGNIPVAEDITLVGIFATNTARKDWPLGIEVCSRLARNGYNVGLLIHTNKMQGDWNLTELCLGFGLQGRTIESTQSLSRKDMPWLYAACDVTLGIGSGEGWGMPIAESLACGVPCVTGDYAGATEFTPSHLMVSPKMFRYDGLYSNKRPVHDPEEWVAKIEEVMVPNNQKRRSLLGGEFMWDQAWPQWEKWFRKGLSGEKYSLISQEAIRKLNYAHHETMTRDHGAASPEENEKIKLLDDASLRSLLVNVPKGGSILELGSAAGGQWEVLREWSDDLTGLDLYEPAVKASQEKGLNIHLGFVEALPFIDGAFDVVCSRHVMEHVADPQKALAEIKRVLKPGGFVAAVTPHRFPDLEPAHITQLRLPEWSAEYQKAGFSVVSANISEFNCVEAHIVARKQG